MRAIDLLSQRLPQAAFEWRIVRPSMGLDAIEENLAAGMIPLRRAQFAAGRLSAHAALRRLSRDEDAIRADADGLPTFPTGVVGSISHKQDASTAVVALRHDVASIGLDLERDEPRDEHAIAQNVLTPTEEVGLARFRVGCPNVLSPSTCILSMKEATYKAVFPSVRRHLDWRDIEVQVDPATRTFSVVSVAERPTSEFRGAFEVADGWIVAVCWQPAQQQLRPV